MNRGYTEMKSRSAKAFTLGLVAALVLCFALIGVSIFFLTRLIGGGRQTMHATDAGALTGARSILAVGLAEKDVAPEFQGLGVDPNTGQPDATNGLMNIFAYNRAGGTAVLIAMNALEEGSSTGIANANRVIGDLQTFGKELNDAIHASGRVGAKIAEDFDATSRSNNVNMMGENTATRLNDDLNFKCVKTGDFGGGGKSNVYFNSSAIGKDPYLEQLAALADDETGTIRSVAKPNKNSTFYELPPTFQEGQLLMKGYAPIVLDPQIRPIYLVSVNPSSQPHLIDQGRFNGSPDQIDGLDYVPVNALAGTTATKETYVTDKLGLSSLACAVVGAIYNEYPVSLPHGYIRVHNGTNALAANPILARQFFNGLPQRIYGSGSIFNNELYDGPGGGGGIEYTDNHVFATVNSPGNYWIDAFIAYNNSSGGPAPFDDRGLSAQLDPSDGLHQPLHIKKRLKKTYEDSRFRSSPYATEGGTSPNVKKAGRPGHIAKLEDMLEIHSIAGVCTTHSYTEPVNDVCSQMLHKFQMAYHPSGSLVVTIPTAETFTNLEALKAVICEKWKEADQYYMRGDVNTFREFHYNVDNDFEGDSGSKVYDRAAPQACPTNARSFAFGEVATPAALLEQLTRYGATCVNLDKDKKWNNPETIQGQLLRRCRQILPSADEEMVERVLRQDTLPLSSYRYIYLPPGGSSLHMSESPPSFLDGTPEAAAPGSTQPDGKPLKPCKDKNVDARDNLVNASIFYPGNIRGDNDLHDQPFQNFNGHVNAHDYATFTPSSGTNLLLGELDFNEHVGAKGKFSNPN
jgi:hypothetical protein